MDALSSDFSAYLSVPRALYSILSTWLEQYLGDFFQPPELPSLNMLLAYLGLNMSGSDLECHVQLLLSQLQQLDPTEPEPGGEEDWGWLMGA